MAERVRSYQYYDVAISICSSCFRKVEGKIVFEDGRVYLRKRCPRGCHPATNGHENVLVADDVDYYRRAREVFLKPSEMPQHFGTRVDYGCPYDCGLCTDHEQHACLTLVEICDHCNLSCPICYASSGPSRSEFRSLDEIERMLDAVVHAEGEPDVVQLSGGEPTVHPEFFRVIEMARERPIRHLMVNTNGIAIAKDPDFAARLADYRDGLEIYLQFDAFDRAALETLRGADLRDIRSRALDRLDEHGISTTLVVTVMRGVNDDALGRVVDFALGRPCVRGVTFQPIQVAGRVDGYDHAVHRMTLTEVRRRILEQTDVFRPEDIIPVPCHPDRIAMAYALKSASGAIPLTGMVDPEVLIEGGRNTIAVERDPELQHAVVKAFSTGHSPASGAESLRELLCCLPKIDSMGQLDYASVFRVIILQFLDAHDFDVRSVKKSCVQIAQPDGRLIPFDTFNLFYRDGLAAERLAPIRAEIEAARGSAGASG